MKLSVSNSASIQAPQRIHYYEIWQPFDPRVYRIQRCNKKWTLEEPYERFGQPLSIENGPRLTVLIDGDTIHVPIVQSPSPEPPHKVFLLFRLYTIEDTNRKFDAIQHHSDVAFYFGDLLSKSTTRYMTCNSEVRYTKKQTSYQQVTLTNPSGSSSSSSYDPSGYWEEVYKTLWDGFIKHEWEDDKEAANPLSIVLNGVPVRQSFDQRDVSFDEYKGLPVQAYWHHKEPVAATEEWFQQAIGQILAARGSTLEAFVRAVHDGLCASTFGDNLHDCFVDVLRCCTLLVVTHPYVGDHRFSNGKEIGSDCFDRIFQALFGDCEDGAGVAYTMFLCLLTNEWKTPEVRAMQQCCVVIGVPIGISGYGKDPNFHGGTEGVCHMYAGVVPYPLLYKAITGKDCPKGDLEALCRRYNIPNAQVFHWPRSSAVMEGTIMTTMYYRDREGKGHRVSPRKRQALKTAKANLPSDDRPLKWSNSAFGFPLNVHDNNGSVVHTKVCRIFTSALQHFMRNTTIQCGGTVVDVRYHHSFVPVIEGKCGIPGVYLFDHMQPTMKEWSMRVTTVMTEESYKLQQEVLDNFDRPLVPLAPKEEDPCLSEPLLYVMHTRYLEMISKWKAVVPRDKNRHLVYYCWRLLPETEASVNKIKEAIQAQGVFLNRYGNGFVFVFIL
jgi:hypothetical protein